jgi:glutamate synthase (ferredoxin)
MTGGVAFLLDETGGLSTRVNQEIVSLQALTTAQQEATLLPMLEAHLAATCSTKAATILADWTSWKSRFKVLVTPS